MSFRHICNEPRPGDRLYAYGRSAGWRLLAILNSLDEVQPDGLEIPEVFVWASTTEQAEAIFGNWKQYNRKSLNPLNKYMGAINCAARSLHDRPSSSPSINPSMEDGK